MARSNGTRARRHRVAIVGGGFGALFAARALSGAEVEVAVIDRTNHHLFQPLLYQVATGILSEGAGCAADSQHPPSPVERRGAPGRGGGHRRHFGTAD